MAQRILIVEDDPDLRALLLELLQAAGYDARAAENGIEGLRSVVDDPPGLVLSDVLMPDLTGLEFCALLKESPRTAHVPVVFLSCVDDVVSGFDVGADDYIVKPFRHRELLARVQAVLRRTEALPPVLATGGLRGNLAQLSLLDILQTLHVGRASGCLAVVRVSSGAIARLWLESGDLAAARLEGPESLSAKDAFFAAAEWDDGVFSFDSADRAEARTVHSSLESLLLEAARLTDERTAAAMGSAGPVRGAAPEGPAAAPDRATLEERVNEIRDRLKVKAFEALTDGRRLHIPRPAPEATTVDPGVTLPKELDELIERMLTGD
ncbi:MAG TPA: response regulator [Thermoleophilia bacterium]|nr:response regulator [Thermoleophilia bacterium]